MARTQLNPFERMSKARTNLLLNYSPFWGTLALGLKLKEDPTLGTLATDGTNLIFDPVAVDQLDDKELIYVVAHEVLHCSQGHMFRIEGRDLDVWNIATDRVVNAILAKAGCFKAPKDILDVDLKDAEKSAEQIYAEEMKKRKQNQGGGGQGGQNGQQQNQGNQSQQQNNQQQNNQQQNNQQQNNQNQNNQNQNNQQQNNQNQNGQNGQQPGNSPQGQQGQNNQKQYPSTGCFLPPPTKDDPNNSSANGDKDSTPPLTEKDWELKTQQAILAAKQAGNVPLGLDLDNQQAEHARSDDLYNVMQRFMERTYPSNWSYQRPNRRFMGSDIIFPGIEKENAPKLVIGYDTSGSIAGDPIANKVLARLITNLAEEYHPDKITVIYCDTKVAGVQEFERDEEIELQPKGGGGTCFAPVFKYVEEEMAEKPTCMIYLTDLETWDWDEFEEPSYPVLWVTMDDCDLEGPWGTTARINHYYLTAEEAYT